VQWRSPMPSRRDRPPLASDVTCQRCQHRRRHSHSTSSRSISTSAVSAPPGIEIDLLDPATSMVMRRRRARATARANRENVKTSRTGAVEHTHRCLRPFDQVAASPIQMNVRPPCEQYRTSPLLRMSSRRPIPMLPVPVSYRSQLLAEVDQIVADAVGHGVRAACKSRRSIATSIVSSRRRVDRVVAAATSMVAAIPISLLMCTKSSPSPASTLMPSPASRRRSLGAVHLHAEASPCR